MNCNNCNSENHSIATFCHNCGKKLAINKEVDYNIPVKKISIFFFVMLAYIAALQFNDSKNSYISLLLIDSLFASIVIVFFLLNYKTIIKLFYIKRFKSEIVYILLIFLPLLALIVHYSARFLNQNVLNSSEFFYFDQFKDSPAPLLFSIISIALFPAIFEEIAFRGILFNELVKITRLKPVILVSAVLFTILHLSIISAIWIFPLGLLFGYFRAKHNTLIYGIIGHFIYNTCIVLFQIILK